MKKCILFPLLLFILLPSAHYKASSNHSPVGYSSSNLNKTGPAKNLLDFGAVGDGKKDDYEAFLKAINYSCKTRSKTLVIPDGYVFNLAGKTMDFTKLENGVILKFEGGILLNAHLIGNRTKIKADRIQIFDRVNLAGTFISLTDYAYPEWYGIFPFDNTLDLVDALQQLYPVFFDVLLGPGDYFTQKGEFQIKGISGISMAKTRVIMETDKSNTYLFAMGKIGGKVTDRTYEYNYIKNLTLYITKKSATANIRGNKGIIIGAVHKPTIENVKIQQSEVYQRFSRRDLEEFLNNENKHRDANVGIEFRGDSELSHLSNIYTLADIGILFSQYTDILYLSDYINDCGDNGLANVYFKREAVKSQNLLFTGTQSWNRGLYGFYSEDSDEWTVFLNTKFENLRIEQLTSKIIRDGKVVSTSIRIGKSNLIANLIFENTILSGGSNGIYIGGTPSGNIYFEKINLVPDITVKRGFAIKAEMLPPSTSPYETPFQIHLRNVNLYHDSNSYFGNRSTISSKNGSEEAKNIYTDSIISYQ